MFAMALRVVVSDTLAAWDHRLAHAALPQVLQFYCIWRPTMAIALTWVTLSCPGGRPWPFLVVLGRGMPGRKNKRTAEKRARIYILYGVTPP